MTHPSDPGQFLLRARRLLPMDGPPVDDGGVLVRGETVAACGGFADLAAAHRAEIRDLGECILLPGLINAHCHLDYTLFRQAILPQSSFAGWIRRINALKSSLTDQDYIRSIRSGAEESLRHGVTAMANIESFPELLPALGRLPLRVWWCLEMLDIRRHPVSDDRLSGILAALEGRREMLGGLGLSPHAPYTASPGLYRLAAECCRQHDLLFTTHVAESRDEWQMFAARSGPLHDLMASIGRPMDDCGHTTPFRHLLSTRALPPGTLCAHMNELDAGDLQALRDLPDGFLHIVHCPASHRYFGHSPFRMRELREAGINICLGTDSLASAPTLNLFHELRAARVAHPWLTAREILEMVTVNAARAIGRGAALGRIAPGYAADLIAVPDPGGEPHDAVVAHRGPVRWAMVAGKCEERKAQAES